MKFKYSKTDNGNCRVYYSNAALLYCLQKGVDNYNLHVCSKDGEPNYSKAINMNMSFEVSPGDTVTDKEVNNFINHINKG